MPALNKFPPCDLRRCCSAGERVRPASGHTQAISDHRHRLSDRAAAEGIRTSGPGCGYAQRGRWRSVRGQTVDGGRARTASAGSRCTPLLCRFQPEGPRLNWLRRRRPSQSARSTRCSTIGPAVVSTSSHARRGPAPCRSAAPRWLWTGETARRRSTITPARLNARSRRHRSIGDAEPLDALHATHAHWPGLVQQLG
jgi:hypothetical protein